MPELVLYHVPYTEPTTMRLILDVNDDNGETLSKLDAVVPTDSPRSIRSATQLLVTAGRQLLDFHFPGVRMT